MLFGWFLNVLVVFFIVEDFVLFFVEYEELLIQFEQKWLCYFVFYWFDCILWSGMFQFCFNVFVVVLSSSMVYELKGFELVIGVLIVVYEKLW